MNKFSSSILIELYLYSKIMRFRTKTTFSGRFVKIPLNDLLDAAVNKTNYSSFPLLSTVAGGFKESKSVIASIFWKRKQCIELD